MIGEKFMTIFVYEEKQSDDKGSILLQLLSFQNLIAVCPNCHGLCFCPL